MIDEVAHYEPPHLDLQCLQIYLFLSPVLKELTSASKVVQPNATEAWIKAQLV